jgi:hypothetical protein
MLCTAIQETIRGHFNADNLHDKDRDVHLTLTPTPLRDQSNTRAKTFETVRLSGVCASPGYKPENLPTTRLIDRGALSTRTVNQNDTQSKRDNSIIRTALDSANHKARLPEL